MPTQILTGQDLGGLTLTPGVYFFASSAQLTGTLTLNDLGNPNAQFVFQIGSTLTTASNSSVVTINGGPTPDPTCSGRLGAPPRSVPTRHSKGISWRLASITMTTGASILDGSALALNGAVTLDTNHINNSSSAVAVPEPATSTLLLLGGVLLGLCTVWKGSKPDRRHPQAA